jgi:hypothetical protein
VVRGQHEHVRVGEVAGDLRRVVHSSEETDAAVPDAAGELPQRRLLAARADDHQFGVVASQLRERADDRVHPLLRAEPAAAEEPHGPPGGPLPGDREEGRRHPARHHVAPSGQTRGGLGDPLDHVGRR